MGGTFFFKNCSYYIIKVSIGLWLHYGCCNPLLFGFRKDNSVPLLFMGCCILASVNICCDPELPVGFEQSFPFGQCTLVKGSGTLQEFQYDKID